MENWLDACENRWLRRIMRIAYKDSHPCATRACATSHKRNDQTTGTNVQLEQTDAIKMVRARVMDESQHQIPKYQTPIPKVYIQPQKEQEDDRRKDGWTVLKRTRDLWRSGVTKCGKQQEDNEWHWTTLLQTDNMEEPNSGINGWNLLDDDYLTWLQSCSYTIKSTILLLIRITLL